MRKIVCGLLIVLCLTTGFLNTGFAESVSCYDSGDFFGQPTVVAAPDGEASLQALGGEVLPASVYLNVNEALEVTDASGKAMGTLRDVNRDLIAGRMIPVLSPSSSAALTELIAFFDEADLTELAVASHDIIILNAASAAKLRVFYRAGEIRSVADCALEIGKANAVGAQVLILSSEDASYDVIRYIQARFKCVWVETDGSAVQVADAIGGGAYGVIAPTAESVYAVFGKINGGKKAENTENDGKPTVLSRSPFIAAHRGDVTLYSENTVGAIRSAAQIGATHAEIDIRLTLDQEIVLLHDDDIKYALRDDNGNAASGTVSRSTLAQLKSYTMSDYISKIATIDEVFAAANEADFGDMVLIVEIKSTEPELITLFRQKVEAYRMEDRIAIISFSEAQMMRVAQELPSVPSSLLLYTTGGETAIQKAASDRSGIDMQYNGGAGLKEYYGDGSKSSAYNDVFRTFADRGYSLWLWTFDTGTMAEAIRYGVTGITTDDAYSSKDNVETLLPDAVIEASSFPAERSTVEIAARTYAGDTVTVSAQIVYLEQGEEEATAVLVYEPENGTGLVSRSVTVRVRGGCGSSAAFGALLPAVLLCAAAAIWLNRLHARKN